MIFDKIENISDYFEELPLLKKVEDFVVDFKNGKLADGTYEIDGKRVFAMVQSYRTRQQTHEMMFEAHKKYIDLLMGHKSKDVSSRVYNHKTLEQLRDTINLFK